MTPEQKNRIESMFIEATKDYNSKIITYSDNVELCLQNQMKDVLTAIGYSKEDISKLAGKA